MTLQSGPRQLPVILIKGLAGLEGDGQRVTAGRSLSQGQGRRGGAVLKDLPRPGEVQEAPEGETSVAGHQGEQIPMQTGDEGRIQFDPQPM